MKSAAHRTITGRPDLQRFAAWLVEQDETAGLTAARLAILFEEWRELTDAPSFTRGQLYRACPGAGIRRRRHTTGLRRWFYKVGGQ